MEQPLLHADGASIAILQSFAAELRLMILKGARLPDHLGLLWSQGANSQSACVLRIGPVDDVNRMGEAIRALLQAAIAVKGRALPRPCRSGYFRTCQGICRQHLGRPYLSRAPFPARICARYLSIRAIRVAATLVVDSAWT
jgi:hypothetical protein